MYMIFKEVFSFNKDGVTYKKLHPISRTKFSSYEKARQHARKWLRKHVDRYFWQPISNPALYDANLKIRKV